MAKLTMLDPDESMEDRKHRQQLVEDCGMVADIVSRRPGISGKHEIALLTGLSHARVARCIKAINANDTPYSRIDYGTSKAKEGPYAGQTVQGWWPMRYYVYQPVMNEADEHSSLVERGVRRSRLTRLAYAKGLTTKAAQGVVAAIEMRLGVQVEELSATDFEAFEALVAAELEFEA